MALTQDINYNALSWVQGELQATFSSAADDLMRYTQQSDANSIAHCIAQLHQTVGILDMLHLSGASMLAAEMQSLASALHAGECDDPEAAQDLLMQALILLPNYLKQLNKTRQDDPLHIIDTINALRLLHAEPEIEPYSLFSPVLSTPLPDYVVPHPETLVSQQDLQQSNLHQTFQMLLLDWIRHTNSGNLIQISQIIHRLRLNSTEERSIQLWWAAEGVIESLLGNGLASDNAAKVLMGELRQPLTTQIQKSESHLLNAFPNELLKKLLFLVAQSTAEGEHTVALKDAFTLHFFDQSHHHQIYNLSADALDQARATLYGEIQQTKEEVSQLEHNVPHASTELHNLSQQLSDMANTLHLLGENEGESLLQTEAKHVSAAVRTESDLNRFQLLSLANALLKVEALVQPTIHDGEGTTPEMEHLQHDVIKECLVEMANVKAALSSLDNNTVTDASGVILTVSHQLYNIAGNLIVIGFSDPADLLTATATRLTDNGPSLSAERLALFAESIAAGELFMEGILQHGQPLDLIIRKAQSNLEKIDTLPTIETIAPLTLSLPTAAEETSVARYINALKQDDGTSDKQNTSVAAYIGQQIQPKDKDTLSLVIPALAIPDDLAQEEIITSDPAPTKDMPEIEIDDDIAEIFAEEADEISREFHDLIPAWREQQDLEALTAIRRYFHTLKGSGRMAQAATISELAWAVENMLNRVLDGIQPPSGAIEQIVVDTHSLLPELIYRFNQRELDSIATVDNLQTRIQEVIDSNDIDALPLEDELRLIFNQEASQHIAALQHEANETENGELPIRRELLRAIHSLKGCAAIANVMPVAILARKLDETLRQLYEQQAPLDTKHSTLLQEILTDIHHVIDQVHESSDGDTPETGVIEDKIARLLPTDLHYIDSDSDDKEAFDPEILAVFLEESDELLADYIEHATRWFHESSTEHRDAVHDSLQELGESAQIAGLHNVRDIYLQMAKLTLQGDASNPVLFDLLDDGHQQLHNQIDSLKHNQPRPAVDGFNTAVESFLTTPETATAPTIDVEPIVVSDTPDTTNATDEDSEEFELLQAFTEEAGELLDSSADAIKRWERDPYDEGAQTQIQRDLHTLKGGSRMTDVPAIANLSHHMETLVLAGVEDNRAIDASFFSLLHRCQDRLAEMHEQLLQRQPLTAAADLQTDIALFVSPEMTSNPAVPPKSESVSNVVPLAPVILPETTHLSEQYQDDEPPTEIILPGKPETAPAAIEQIRVRSDLLDNLSNFAGEVSIARDRASQQNIAAQQQINELGETVIRLQEQLRNLEIETEAQILFRYEDTASGIQTEFDPLELDRFSMIQQLSRSLTESVSDLNDIRHSMAILARETEDVLLQQSRVNTELQQGLMNTRLLPFSGLVARLDRIVRQTSNELNKPTELVITGAERELDRTVLNRILAPIEHLLRNAISHGIETAEQRRDANKPETGKIQLLIEHEGPEVVLTLSDDGQGIDLDKVRQKALEQGLITEDQLPSDEELIQLILASGFSTSDDVSQLAGRGVGMEIVNNEIRALKGRLSIHSVAGQGTTFSIHLPLRLSIVQALIIQAQDQQYAIPLSNIHTILQPNIEQINTLLSAPPTANFEYAEEDYQFFSLNTLLNQAQTAPSADAMPSLLLFRTRTLKFALLVDAVYDNREIVVKPLSTQLNSIDAINGATILGDGQIIFILDLLALIEHVPEPGQAAQTGPHINAIPDRPAVTKITERIAMVVDDSITMRKATGNFLKRNGFTVITARDGLEAIALLHEQVPDIILLDIEMPRMDGYEFATHVRHDDEFKALPIIMITSRDSEKHRDRAMTIGVNDYIGKPYQEEKLLAKIEALIGPDPRKVSP